MLHDLKTSRRCCAFRFYDAHWTKFTSHDQAIPRPHSDLTSLYLWVCQLAIRNQNAYSYFKSLPSRHWIKTAAEYM